MTTSRSNRWEEEEEEEKKKKKERRRRRMLVLWDHWVSCGSGGCGLWYVSSDIQPLATTSTTTTTTTTTAGGDNGRQSSSCYAREPWPHQWEEGC